MIIPVSTIENAFTLLWRFFLLSFPSKTGTTPTTTPTTSPTTTPTTSPTTTPTTTRQLEPSLLFV